MMESDKAGTGRTSPAEGTLPTHTGETARPRRLAPNIKAAGESGRTGFHPFHFFKITWRSSSSASKFCNLLWPTVPAAIALRYTREEQHLAIFVLSYLAMVPCANLIGFSGQSLARKLPHVAGVLIETVLGGVVEIILFMSLLKEGQIAVIQAAILGSILATMLLCLGLCFLAGGIRREEQTFSEVVSEAGSGLLLTAGVALAVPTVFDRSLQGTLPADEIAAKALDISRITAIFLLIAYVVYIYFQTHTHHSIYDAIFEHDEERDHDREKDLAKDKLTLTESILALVASVALVTIIAITLVGQIEFMVNERHVPDAFLGLILVPLVEKAAEHLTAIDEAWDNQMNFALSHVLGATLQTALFNAPLSVLVGWGLDKGMGFDFEVFDIVMLILGIITVGGFLRDQKSNYLEGCLCVTVYLTIATASFYYPNPTASGGESGAATASGAAGTGATPSPTGSER